MNYLSAKEIQNALLDVMKTFHTFCNKYELPYYMIGGSMLGAFRHSGFIPWDDDMDVAMTRNNYERFIEIANRTGELKIHNYRNSKNISYCLTRIYLEDFMIESDLDPKLDRFLYFDIFVLDNVPDSLKKQEKQARRISSLKKIIRLKTRYKCANSFFGKIFRFIIHVILLPVPYNWLVKKVDNVMKCYSNGNQSEYICSMNSQYSYQKQKMKRDVFGKPTPYIFEGCEFFGVEKPKEYLSHLFGDDYMNLPPEEKRRSTAHVYKNQKN